MPKFLEKLQQIIRERGQLPPWMEEFIEPVEVSEKESDDEESDQMREIVIRASETDSDDEGITDMESESLSLVFEDNDENQENYEEKKGSEKETENEATYGEEDEDNYGNGVDHEELEVKGRRASEKESENEARDGEEDDVL